MFSSLVDALRSSVQRPMRVCGAVDDDSNCAELQSAKALIMAGVGHHSRSELVRTFLEGVTYWSIGPGKLFKILDKALSAFLRLVDVHSCSVRMKSAMRFNLNGVNDHCMFLVLNYGIARFTCRSARETCSNVRRKCRGRFFGGWLSGAVH